MRRMAQRLNADWFHRYMLDPTRYRPGTRMPLSFPDGKSTLTSVFNGDANQQIDAMWAYLAEGDKAREPVGLDAEAIVLTPTDKPIIYRNFLEGLGPRGIAVGMPEQVNYAWDAGAMSLSLVWKNGFIDASKHWVGRGPGNQSPLGDFVVPFETTSPFAVLKSKDAEWPSDSPRKRGYKFDGYRLNAAGQPVFRYRFGDVAVEDAIVPVASTNGQAASGIARHLTLRIEKDTAGLVFRAVRGNITANANGYVLNDQLKLSIQGANVEVVELGGQKELRAVLPHRAK